MPGKGQPVPLTTHGSGERARFVLAVLSPAGLDGGVLSRGEQIPLLTLAVLIYMWAFITCVGADERRLEMKNVFCVCVFFTPYSSGEVLLCSHSPVAHHASLHIQAGSRENILLYPKSYCAVISGIPLGRGNIPLEINILEVPICTNWLFFSSFSTCYLTLQPSATTLKTQKIQPLLHVLSCGICTA